MVTTYPETTGITASTAPDRAILRNQDEQTYIDVVSRLLADLSRPGRFEDKCTKVLIELVSATGAHAASLSIINGSDGTLQQIANVGRFKDDIQAVPTGYAGIYEAPCRTSATASSLGSNASQPVQADGQRVGMVLLESRHANPFTPAQVRFLDMIGNIIGLMWSQGRISCRLDSSPNMGGPDAVVEKSKHVSMRLADSLVMETANSQAPVGDSEGMRLAAKASGGCVSMPRVSTPDRQQRPIVSKTEAMKSIVLAQRGKTERALLECEARSRSLAESNKVESIQQSYTELSREVADRKRTEEVLAERTAALATLGELASEIAHELNNPLAAVMTFAHLLKSQELPGVAGEDVEKIFTEAQRAAKVVHNLLAFARRNEPDKAYADVVGAVDRALSLKGRELSANKIEVKTDYESGLPKTMVDEHQLTQVFLNIIANADQTMTEHRGGGNLWIRGWREGSSLRFSFRDDGPGISEENKEKIFDPFFTTKKEGKGTGLGLSMCQRMVRAHGGRIWVESIEGEGTTFHVELPIERPEGLEGLEDLEGLDGTGAGEGEKGGKIKGRWILVVDDEAVFTDPLCRILSREGHVVEVARDGEEAWRAIGRQRYECILMDVRMPGMGGKELYRRIKENDEGLARRVIFATGDTLNPETQEFLESTGNAWLGKPFSVEELESRIQECLAQQA